MSIAFFSFIATLNLNQYDRSKQRFYCFVYRWNKGHGYCSCGHVMCFLESKINRLVSYYADTLEPRASNDYGFFKYSNFEYIQI